MEMKPSKLRENALLRIKELEKLKQCCLEDLEASPNGYIRIQKRKGACQYYLRTNPGDFNGKYVPKQEISLVEKILQRNYSERMISEINSELSALKEFVSRYPVEEFAVPFRSLSKERQRLIHPYFLPDREYTKKWQEEKYTPLEFEKNTPEFYTSSGLRVRSKSEIIIAEALARNRVPFRYEYPLRLGSMGIVYPDFYCLNVKNRREIPWEHFGMMDNEQYAMKNVNKLERYIQGNFLPGKNLLITMETSRQPVDTRVVERIITEFLL